MEFILFALTVAKAFKQSRRAISSMPIAYVLYRDGALYFIVITRKSSWRYHPSSMVWLIAILSMLYIQSHRLEMASSFVFRHCKIVSALIQFSCSTANTLSHSFSLGLVNAMASRMVLNLRQLGGVRNDATPPTVYFMEAVPSQVCKDGELTFDARCISSEPREIRFQHPYGNFNRITSPPRKDRPLPSSSDLHSAHSLSKKKRQNGPHDDPYFYNRQANQLRALKVRRPAFNFTVTPTLPEPEFAETSSFMGTAEIEETAARGAITPASGGMHSKRSSIMSSRLGPPAGEVYNMETWSVTTIPFSQTQTRDVEVQSSTSSDEATDPKARRGPGWNYV